MLFQINTLTKEHSPSRWFNYTGLTEQCDLVSLVIDVVERGHDAGRGFPVDHNEL